MSATAAAPAVWSRDGFEVDCDPSRLDLDVIHGFLTAVYWAEGRSRAGVARCIDGSLNFGLYRLETAALVGYGRVVSDGVTFAWLTDVFVLEDWRGRGLGSFLVACMLAHPHLAADSIAWALGTRDGHALYRRFGFADAEPGRVMRRRRTGEC